MLILVGDKNRWIDCECCNNCGQCANECPVVAIREDEAHECYWVDHKLCLEATGCGEQLFCSQICPVDAICERGYFDSHQGHCPCSEPKT